MIRKLISYLCLFLCLYQSYAEDRIIPFEGKRLHLEGKWNLVMNEFLDYQAIQKNPEKVLTQVPGIWNDVLWNQEKVGANGYGTYYTSFIYPIELPDTTLAIEIPEVSQAYKLYVNEKYMGQVGTPGRNGEETKPKIEYKIFDFEVKSGDTLTLILHISNYENKTGGLWYAPSIDYESKMIKEFEINRSIKLIILGCFLIGGLFQLSIFILNPREKFCIYFFLVCMTLAMIIITRGDLILMDFLPGTSWGALKKTLYLAIALTGASNALFLREIYPKFFPKKVIDSIAIIGGGLAVFVLLVSPRVSYSTIPWLHGYNILIGIYLMMCLIRAAFAKKYGARFLLIGYIAVFLTLVHDMLSSQYVISAYTFELMYIGITLYIIQLMLLLSSRYLFALRGKEELSNHLKKVNKELEEMVGRRTKALREKNEIIESKNAELEKAMKEKDHLMAVVAHDLKAPLSSIMGISELMDSDLKGQSAHFNEMIKKVTIDGRAMIENLTELKVFEQEDYEVLPSLLAINDFFKQKKIAFEQIASKKNITFNAQLDCTKENICIDTNVLSRIIDNLLSNALKFTPKGGEVNFNLLVDKKELKIVVKDNGPGFSDKDKSKVFKKFQRLSARPTAGESSAGLGLSIVKTLVNLLKGSIDLESEQTKGATFTVTIPI